MYLLHIFLFVIVLVLSGCSSTKTPLIWNIDDINQLRDCSSRGKIRNIIINKADSIVSEKDVSISYKTVSVSGDTHNYESIAPYWWPDTTKIDCLPYIRRDGITNPERMKDDSNVLKKLKERLLYLSVAYHLTKDDKYYISFCRQIGTWFISKETRMNPNFEFAQIVKGRYENKGRPYGIIDAYIFNDIIESIRLVEMNKKLPIYLNKPLKEWFVNFNNWLLVSENGKKEKETTNNHSIAYDVLVTNIAIYTGNNKLANESFNTFFKNRLYQQISADGSQKEELKRTKAYTYSIYNLSNIIDMFLIVKNFKKHLDEDNFMQMLKAAVYLHNYIGNRDGFPYQEIGKWESKEKYLRMQINRINRIKKQDILPRYNVNKFVNIETIIK